MEDEVYLYHWELKLNESYRVSRPFPLQTFVRIQLFVALFVTGNVTFLGIISNIVNLIIFGQMGVLSHSCYVFLTANAVSGFFFSFHYFMGAVHLYFQMFMPTYILRWSTIQFYTNVCEHPAMMFSDVTTLLTALVAVERLVYVAYHLKANSNVKLTVKRCCAAVLCIYAGMLVLHLPHFLDKVPRWTAVGPNGGMVMLYVVSGLISREVLIYVIQYGRSVLRILSIFTVLLCNVRMQLELKQLKQRLRRSPTATPAGTAPSLSQPDFTWEGEKQKQDADPKRWYPDAKSKNEVELLRTVYTLCILFSLCHLIEPADLAAFHITGRDIHFYIHYTVHLLSVLFQSCNAASSVFVYYFTNSRYRDELQRWFGKKKKRERM